MSFRYVLKREWQLLWQGRFPVATILILLPLAFTLAFGIIYYQNSVEGISLVICDEEQSVISRTIIQAYSDAEKFHVVDQVTRSEDMVDDLHTGKARVGLYIPADISKDIKLGNPVPLLLTVDSANNMFGNAALTAASEINKTLSVGIASKLLEAGNQLPAAALNMAYPVRLGIRIINNPTTGYTPFMLAGLTLNGLQIAIMLVLCPLIAREFRHHVYDKKVPSWLILGTKCFWVLALAVPSFFLSLGFLYYLFAVPVRGSLAALAVMITAFCLAVAGIMVLFSAFSPDEVMSIEMPLLYIMPGLLYSGLSWPDFYMSDVASAIARIFPMRHAADSVRDILLAGYAPELMSQSLQLLLMGAVAFALGTAVFALRRRYGMKTVLEVATGGLLFGKKGGRP
ncbi:MAG: ABC transporter permease [Megasphaera sp.]|uniref:ABC transporter permease n=1 Tax=Megasphaera sp. TaxID=2023260 RepID=UPI0025C335A8|nr:ABC transporter permease [Megasphaera sp.]MCF0153374.1 ABC transporter permease [Megasphaera sp.]MCI7601192.1 ABC transporter permease [Megasphaera sp.]